jgi:hypothetical protein
LTPEVPANAAHQLIDCFDGLLLELANGDENAWFPSPYGGAIAVHQVEDALRTAKVIIRELTALRQYASVGITWGQFERVHSVNRWNVAALALNTAARMAHATELRGGVGVSPKVFKDAVQAHGPYATFFGDACISQVKSTRFEFHRVIARGYSQPKSMKAAQAVTTRVKTRNADIIVFDIEHYSAKGPSEQATLANNLSHAVETAMSSTGISPALFGPAGDGGYLAFVSTTEDLGPKAWTFAQYLQRDAAASHIPLRIGLANGPVTATTHRPAVGGAVLDADRISSYPPSGGIAVAVDFWTALPDHLKYGTSTLPAREDARALIIQSKSEYAPANLRVLNILVDAPPITVRTVIITVHDRTKLDVLLNYFMERHIRIIATPNTGVHIHQLGHVFTSTFDYTHSQQLSALRGTLHPYILESIAAVSTDPAQVDKLRHVGLDSIDLVVANTQDPTIGESMTASDLLDQLANVQIGGAGLIRWTLKHWRSAAAIVDPDDYLTLVADLRRNDDTISPPMRLALMRRSMQYVRDRDNHTGQLFKALWPWLS